MVTWCAIATSRYASSSGSSGPVVWITAGEASGDLVGAMLAVRLREQVEGVRIFAVGGPRLVKAADELLADSSNWGAIGIARSLPKVPMIALVYRRLLRLAGEHPPVLHIPIDFGAMNIPLARRMRGMGTKVLYYMPPGSWRKTKQGRDLPCVADLIATPFEWSARILGEMGARAEWVGHPLLDALPPAPAEREPLIVVMPGSRDHEISANLPVIAAACATLKGYRFVAALTPHADATEVRRIWGARCGLELGISVGENARELSRARGAVICSGTATLEAAVADCPLVVVYRGDAVMNFEYRLRKPKFEFIALPSILLGRKVCEELIQEQATPERIAAALTRLLVGPEREAQLADLAQVRAALGERGASERVATMAAGLLAEAPSR